MKYENEDDKATEISKKCEKYIKPFNVTFLIITIICVLCLVSHCGYYIFHNYHFVMNNKKIFKSVYFRYNK